MANVENVRSAPRVTFLDALRVPEFRVIWLADAQSAVGDQLARVALSVLVFERTSSALLTALAYSLTFLPALIGGALLSGLADRVGASDGTLTVDSDPGCGTCVRAVLPLNGTG